MSGAKEMAVAEKLVAVKDSETEIIRKVASGLVQEAELRVVQERFEKYLKIIKNFGGEKLKKTDDELSRLSEEEIKAIDFLIAPRAKRMTKIWGLVNLAYISGVVACAILINPVLWFCLVLLCLNGAALESGSEFNRMWDFLIIRRPALEYLKKKEAEIKIEG